MRKTHWAIVTTKNDVIEDESYFASGDCCCGPEPTSVAIYDSLEKAKDSLGTYYKEQGDHKIVKVHVTKA